MLSDLHAHGLAVQSASDLIPTDLLNEFSAHIASMVSPGQPSERKPYLVQWLGRYPKHQHDSIWARIADVLQPIAQDYLDTPRLFFYNLWQSLPTTALPRDSQLWHQDIEDTRLLKAFLYLSDVTDGAGPLTYIPGTHWRGTRRLNPKVKLQRMQHGPLVARVSDGEMVKCVPEAEWRTLTVPKGTLVLCDTTGWHKGGYATTAERLCAVWHWTGKVHPPSRLQW